MGAMIPCQLGVIAIECIAVNILISKRTNFFYNACSVAVACHAATVANLE